MIKQIFLQINDWWVLKSLIGCYQKIKYKKVRLFKHFKYIMTEYLNCDKEECVDLWEYENYDEWYEDNCQDHLPKHCEIKGCHEIYIKGKNGNSCVSCGLDVCESCFEKNLMDDGYDVYCLECHKEMSKEEEEEEEE